MPVLSASAAALKYRSPAGIPLVLQVGLHPAAAVDTLWPQRCLTIQHLAPGLHVRPHPRGGRGLTPGAAPTLSAWPLCCRPRDTPQQQWSQVSETSDSQDLALVLQTRFHPRAAVESDAGAPTFWTVCPDPWYRHFIHGALHPDPSQRMSPAEMCLHPFLEPAMRAVVPASEQHDWRFTMHQWRLRSPAAKARGPEARLVSGGASLQVATAW